MCFGCLIPGHGVKTCKRRFRCKICHSQHPTCLHDNSRTKGEKSSQEATAKEEKSELTASSIEAKNPSVPKSCSTRTQNFQSGTYSENRIICAAIPVKLKVKGQKKSVITYMRPLAGNRAQVELHSFSRRSIFETF